VNCSIWFSGSKYKIEKEREASLTAAAAGQVVSGVCVCERWAGAGVSEVGRWFLCGGYNYELRFNFDSTALDCLSKVIKFTAT